MRHLLILALLATGALAQGLSSTVANVSAAQFPEIRLTLTVFSEKGRPVAGLTKDAFTLQEDGAPVALKSVEVGKQPISVALVLDCSAAMAGSIDAMRESALSFVRGLEDGDTVAVIAFGDGAKVAQERTGNRDKVRAALDKLQAGGAAALFDGIDAAVQELRPVDRRRMILAFTAGRDLNRAGTAPQSTHSVKSVAKLARETGMSIWTIGLGGAVDRELLTKLARVTGGASYFPKDAGTVRAAFARALVDVRASYDLAYVSPKASADGTTRNVTVTSAHAAGTSQGVASYTAPAPPPPVAAASPAGAGGKAGPTSTVRVKLSTITFKGFKTGSLFMVWPHGMTKEQARRLNKLTYVTRRECEVAPGKWHVALSAHPDPIPLATVDMQSGATAVIQAP